MIAGNARASRSFPLREGITMEIPGGLLPGGRGSVTGGFAAFSDAVITPAALASSIMNGRRNARGWSSLHKNVYVAPPGENSHTKKLRVLHAMCRAMVGSE